jgi:hypothetical protein
MKNYESQGTTRLPGRALTRATEMASARLRSAGDEARSFRCALEAMYTRAVLSVVNSTRHRVMSAREVAPDGNARQQHTRMAHCLGVRDGTHTRAAPLSRPVVSAIRRCGSKGILQ